MNLYHDVMCDIETTGTDYGRNAIIQISGVKFDYETEMVSEDFFDRCLHIHPGREWDPDCRAWWTKQGPVLGQIQARAEDPHTVIRDFYNWLLKDWPNDRPEGMQFWSKPSSFDHPFLSNYFKMFGYDMPCHYRYVRDLNSFMAGLRGTTTHPEFVNGEPEFQGDEHNALHDVLHQIRLLFAMKNQTVRAEIVA